MEQNDDYVQCKLCDFKASKIGKHVTKEHNLTVEQYKEKYGAILSKNYLQKLTENGKKAVLTVDSRVYRHKCRNCENIIEGKDQICQSCKTRIKRANQEEKFINKIEGIDFVRCQICGWPDTRLSSHIKQHNDSYTSERYKQLFNAPVLCKSLIDKTRTTGKTFHNKGLKKEL
jgi:RNase P subunit RPR2